MSDQAMIKRLNQRINGLRKQIAEMARNQGAQSGQNIETIRQDISRCEMQFIRSKKTARKQERRRQTWHSSAYPHDSRQDSSETEQDSLRALVPPPPAIFTIQRGSDSVHNYETFEILSTDEQFEPGETVSFDRTLSPTQIASGIHTPIMFGKRLSSILEVVDTPQIGTVSTSCDR